jgi:hypothetical protein
MAYLRNVRLDLVTRATECAQHGNGQSGSVARLPISAELQICKGRFGQTPSETLKSVILQCRRRVELRLV